MIWYNTFQTLAHAERIYAYNSGMHYTIIIRFKKMCILRTCLGSGLLPRLKTERTMVERQPAKIGSVGIRTGSGRSFSAKKVAPFEGSQISREKILM